MLAALLPSVPRFMTLPSIGLDISDTSLKYIEVSKEDREGDRALKQWGDISIPSGVLDRGEVLDPQQLVAVLTECKKETGAQFVRASLPEERAYLFETEVKRNTSLKEIRNLLEFRLAENVPLPAQDVLFDYQLLPGLSDERTIHVAVTAYGRETVQTYYEACMQAGMQPLAFEVEAQAMARSTIPRDTQGAVMLIDFGKTRTGIGIVLQDTLLYTSTIEYGGDRLSAVLRKELGDDIGEKELTKLKNTQGLVHGADSSDIHDALINTVSVIRDELATRMQYWHLRTNNDPHRRLGQVILCGGSSNLKGLPAYLSESLGVPVVRGNVWENMFSFSDTIPPIDLRHSLGYATAIGLALSSDSI